MNQESSNKTWVVGCISAAAIIIAAIIGLGMPFAQNIAARYLPPFTPTANSAPPTLLVTILPQSVDQVTAPTNVLPTVPVPRCEWLAKSFPQSIEEIAARWGLSTSRINLLYEGCGSTVTAFVVTLGSEVELQVYEEGGCIDAPSDASFTGDHLPNPYASGERAYSGAVIAMVMTYRMWCDELH